MPSTPFVSRGGVKLAGALDYFKLDVSRWVCADLGSHVGGFVDCLLRRGAARVYAVDTAYGTLAWKLRRHPNVVVFERTSGMHVVLPEPVDLLTIDVGWTPQARILPNAARLLRPTGYASASTAALSNSARVDTGNGPGVRAAGPPCVITLIKPHYEAGRLCSASSAKDAGIAGKRRAREVRRRGARQASPARRTTEALPDHLANTLLKGGVLPDDQVDSVVHRVLDEIGRMNWKVMGTCPSPVRGHGGNREVFALLTRPPESKRPPD